jgi:hypothetical protein
MYSAVRNKSLKRNLGYLAPESVECRQNHRLGRIINDHIDTGCGFECANVATLLADDPTFHLIALNVQNADGCFDGMVDGGTLYRLYGDPLRLFLRVDARLIAYLTYGLCRLGFCLAEQIFGEHLFCLVDRHTADAFETSVLLLYQLFQPLFFFIVSFDPVLQIPFKVFDVLFFFQQEFQFTV